MLLLYKAYGIVLYCGPDTYIHRKIFLQEPQKTNNKRNMKAERAEFSFFLFTGFAATGRSVRGASCIGLKRKILEIQACLVNSFSRAHNIIICSD